MERKLSGRVQAPEREGAMPAIESNWMDLIGHHLRADGATIAREELPRRWNELIQSLNERERQRDEREKAQTLPERKKKVRREIPRER
jgi:hypothetical protein